MKWSNRIKVSFEACGNILKKLDFFSKIHQLEIKKNLES